MAVGNILNKGEEQRLVRLIGDVERHTSGEIRIHVTKKTSRKGPIFDASKAFHALKMDKTALRNGILIFIGIKNHDIACIGDEGIHKIVGQETWEKVVAMIRASFSKGDYYLGLHKAVEFIGELLKTHFPHEHGDENPNELPNEISSS